MQRAVSCCSHCVLCSCIYTRLRHLFLCSRFSDHVHVHYMDLLIIFCPNNVGYLICSIHYIKQQHLIFLMSLQFSGQESSTSAEVWVTLFKVTLSCFIPIPNSYTDRLRRTETVQLSLFIISYYTNTHVLYHRCKSAR